MTVTVLVEGAGFNGNDFVDVDPPMVRFDLGDSPPSDDTHILLVYPQDDGFGSLNFQVGPGFELIYTGVEGFMIRKKGS